MPFHTKRIAKLRTGRPGKYQHFFGGPPRHRGATPKGRRHPVHLIYDLDLNDPKLGLQFPGITRLPLYNAIQYNCCEMIYRVADDETIEILSLSNRKWLPDHPYKDYPPEFPQAPVVAEQISYDDYKTLVFGFSTSNHPFVNMWSDLSDQDRQRARELQYPFTQVGGTQFMWQGVPICPAQTEDASTSMKRASPKYLRSFGSARCRV